MGNRCKSAPERPGRRRRRLSFGCCFELTDLAVLIALIEPVVRDHGCDLVRVQLNGSKAAPTLQVMAENPATGQLGIDVCASISRALSDLFDEVDPIESEYQLEVSSPGIDRPLTRPADWTRWATHDVRIRLAAPVAGKKNIHGTITGLSDSGDAAIIAVPGQGSVTVALASMSGAKLVLTNRLINATRPAGMAGFEGEPDMGQFDDIIEDAGEPANDNSDEDEE